MSHSTASTAGAAATPTADGPRVALVTGGSRGIGAAVVRRLAADGADVAFTYVSHPDHAEKVVAEVEALGRRAVALRADSADPAAVVGAVEATVDRLGRLDVLVNNAGIGSLGPLEGFTLDDVDRTLDVHVRAAFLASQAAARHLGPGGSIVTIGSCLAERTGTAGVSLYSMSKAAVVGLTKGLARDLGERGITANVVHPGPIDTDMNPADGPDADGERAFTALGRFGQADEVADAVAFLAGPGGRYVTGAALAVDGGWAA
jgi:NAD(P)-dependent dehydrogenase (short-subunit alcohol dehydrogenase family)